MITLEPFFVQVSTPYMSLEITTDREGLVADIAWVGLVYDMTSLEMLSKGLHIFHCFPAESTDRLRPIFRSWHVPQRQMEHGLGLIVEDSVAILAREDEVLVAELHVNLKAVLGSKKGWTVLAVDLDIL